MNYADEYVIDIRPERVIMEQVNKRIIGKTLSRLAAIQAIYVYEINSSQKDSDDFDIHTAILDVIALHDEESEIASLSKEFLSKLVMLTYEHLSEIDKMITSNLTKHENTEKLNLLLRSLLRCAVAELFYYKTPYKVVIDEYVALTKDFFNDAEISFVNAILDKIHKEKK